MANRQDYITAELEGRLVEDGRIMGGRMMKRCDPEFSDLLGKWQIDSCKPTETEKIRKTGRSHCSGSNYGMISPRIRSSNDWRLRIN